MSPEAELYGRQAPYEVFFRTSNSLTKTGPFVAKGKSYDCK